MLWGKPHRFRKMPDTAQDELLPDSNLLVEQTVDGLDLSWLRRVEEMYVKEIGIRKIECVSA